MVRKKVVTKHQRVSRKASGDFNFTHKMIPIFSNGKPEAEFITKYRTKAWEAYKKLKLSPTAPT